MLKKFVSLVVGVSLALATIGVAAADPAVQTQSVYDASAKTLTVVTTVTNPEDGSTYTYLAYDKDVTTIADLEAGQIKYVDQKVYNEANGANLAFEFETTTNDSAKLYQDIIKVGGKTAAGAAYTVAESAVDENVVDPTVTLNEEAVNATFGAYVTSDVADTDLVQITVPGLSTLATSVVYTAKDGSTTVPLDDYISVGNVIWVKKAHIMAASSIAVTANTDTVRCSTLDIGYIAEDTADGASKAKAVIVVGQITGQPRSFGIIFSKNSDFTNSEACAALGRASDGKYAVKLRNFNLHEKFADAEKVYGKVYYTYYEDPENPSEENVKQAYGAPFVVEVTATEGFVLGSKYAAK